MGNTVLKLSEGLAEKMIELLKHMLGSSVRAKMGAVMMADQLKSLKKMFDYSEYGGAPILGVQGAVIKIHGSSNANAVRNAIIKSIPFVENRVVEIIADAVASLNTGEQEEDQKEVVQSE